MANIIPSVQLIEACSLLRIYPDLHIAISHRSYLRNDGGIEHCIRRESHFANHHKIDYLHLCPFESINRCRSSSYLIEVTLNNLFIGITHLDGFSAKLCVLHPTISFLHSSLGFDSDSFLRLLFSLRQCGPILQWIHDLSYLCESVTLVRNGLACGIPLFGADICHECTFESSRASLRDHYDLIERLSDFQAFPSSVAQLRYNFSIGARGRLCTLQQFVLPHCTVNCFPSVDAQSCAVLSDKPIGIAFFGHSVSHKGWTEYIQMVDALEGLPAYRFYHVGTVHHTDSRIEFLSYSEAFEAADEVSLRATCASRNIKLAFFWPVALESFGLLLRQVIGAGLAILSSDSNHAQREYITNCKHIRYFSRLDQLVTWLSSDREGVDTLLREASQSTCVLEWSQCSYELLVSQSVAFQLSSALKPRRLCSS